MSNFCTKVLVIKTRDFGEADRIVLFLSEDFGKFEAVVRGARRPRSRFAGNIQLFSLLDAQFFSGKSLDQLSQANLIRPFSKLSEDLVKLAYAGYWAELLVEFLPEREPLPEVFRFMLAAMLVLEQTENPHLLSLAFQMRILTYLGYQPYLEDCLECNDDMASEKEINFSVADGGIICSKCFANVHHDDLRRINRAELLFLRNIGQIDIRKLAELDLQGVDLLKMRSLLRAFIEYRVDHVLKAQIFLDAVLEPIRL